MALKGTANLIAKIRQLDARAREAARLGVSEVAEFVNAESFELCPTSPSNPTFTDEDGGEVRNPFYNGHPGALRESRRFEDATIDGDAITASIKYTADYAVYVHENTDARHGVALKAAYPQLIIGNERGQAKFLSIPLIKARYMLLPAVNHHLKGAFDA